METKSNPTVAPAPSRSVLGIVCLTVFLDIVGFSILFPLFPKMLEHYLALGGSESAIGGLLAQLKELAGGNQIAVATLFGGALGSAYSLLQFLFAPIWGGLSDRIGRRPTLLVTLFGTAVAHLLWVFAGSFGLLIAARVVAGICAGNISTATAVVADTTAPADRARGMGLVGMSIGLGFILGPAIGGLSFHFAAVDLSGTWQEGLAWNPFSVPALIACALAFINLAWVVTRLPETHAPDASSGAEAGSQRRGLNPFAALSSLAAPGVARVCLLNLAFLTIFSGMEFTLTFLALERLDYGPAQNAVMFVVVGLLIALVQGGVVRRLAPKRGEKNLALLGLVFLIPAFVLVGLAQSQTMLYAGLVPMAVGSALAMPCLSALVSRYATESSQGLALGTFRSMGALSRAIGPLVFAAIFWRMGSQTPYLLGAALLLIPIAMCAGLPPVKAAK